jgi:hypothetical protein
MSVSTRDAANALKPVSAIRWRDGVLRSINAGKIRDAAGVLRTFFTSMTATVNNADPSGYEYGTTSASVFTNPATIVSVTGGTAPYAYAWVRLSGDVSVTATVPAGPTTQFTAFLPVDGYATAVFQCTVTDASGATATVQVTIILNNVSTS